MHGHQPSECFVAFDDAQRDAVVEVWLVWLVNRPQSAVHNAARAAEAVRGGIDGAPVDAGCPKRTRKT